MISPPLSPRTVGAPSLALLALVLCPGLAQATTTTKGGAAHAAECEQNGVPSPPDWGSDQWVLKGNQTTLIQADEFTEAKVYLYKGYSPQGICVAMPRTTPGGLLYMRLGIICQGHTGKVCFWDNVEPVSPTGTTPVVAGPVFLGGKDLEGRTLACSGCHVGENPFIVHKDTTLDLKDSKGVSILNAGTWPDLLVPASWPQNPPPATGLSQCTQCHNRPTSTNPSAGRLPAVSTRGGYCDQVLKLTVTEGLMPPTGYYLVDFAIDVAALWSKCDIPPPSPTPPAGPGSYPIEMPEAFKGRFVFGDQDSNIYAVKPNGELVFYKHSGATDGTNHWNIAGNVVGWGWANFKKLFTGGRGVIYAVTADDRLLWYKHTGQVAGTPDWHPSSGNQVGSGWSFNQLFATTNGDGVIYAVQLGTGRLHWYKHTGFDDGTSTWAAGSGNLVGGPGWDGLSRLMAGPGGVIYGVNSQHNLLWFKHTGFASGTGSWGPNTGAVVGWGWTASTMFTGSQGRIYTLDGNLNLLWYRHLGYSDGTGSWVDNHARLVATNWLFMPQPYFD